MTPQEIIQVVQSLGVAVVAMGAMGWFVKYMFDKFMIMTDEQAKAHKEEMTTIKEALDNNTLALQRLSDKLENK